jgi:diketogulonate reductase-like aldo/keto reductase
MGVIAVPATTSAGHLRENLAATDLELTAEDISAIDGLAPERAA